MRGSGEGRGRRLRWLGALQFVGDLVLRFLKFLHRLAHAARQLGQLFRAEEDEDEEQNNDQIRTGQVGEECEEVHGEDEACSSPGLLAKSVF